MAPLLSQYSGIGSVLLGTIPSSVTKFFIHTASLAASEAVMISASVVELVVEPCLEQRQVTAPPLMIKTYHPDRLNL